ncbi:MAG TPA: uroporphyrinogen-III C-methyltransferase [Caulobacteraceae bacterium]
MPRETGKVLLVGAGPGAADLLTVRALRAIEGAQALLYDALVAEEIIALAPSACVRVQVGKRAGRASMSQETINRLMLRLAKRGLDVVRLKGGDPSIFGRSGEEVEFLRAHGIEVEIVPGVTAASAAAAQFGFPLTHRGEARRLVMATARAGENQADDGDWACLADPQTTAAFYMGRDTAGEVAARLIARGRKPSTPAIAVENASRADARLIGARLDQLGQAVEAAGFSGPVLLVVGEATARARAWTQEASYREALRTAR